MKTGLYIIAIFYGLVIIAVAVVGVRSTFAATVINLVLLAGLIGLTAMYAYSTHKIAEATRAQASEIKKQADASAEMAKEMRDAKFEALRPIVWIIQPRPHWPKGQDLPQHITIQLENKGLGPALNILLKFIHPFCPFSEQYIPFMAVGMNGSWALTSLGAIDTRLAESSFIQASYEDVYGRKFESELEGELDAEVSDFRIGRFTTRQLS